MVYLVEKSRLRARIAALPEPFKSNSTAQQKALVLMLWVMKETGII